MRFVTRDDVAFAVYYADFAAKHGRVHVLASFGAWEEDSDPADRTAFAFQIWMSDDGYQIGLVDADDSGYRDGFLGRILNRNEALEHPLKPECFALSDHIVECDRPVIEFLHAAHYQQR